MKLIVFDLDGTILDHTEYIWQTLHQYFQSPKHQTDDAMNKFFNKKISYQEWLDHDIKLMKSLGANKKQILKALKDITLMPGTKETLKELKKRKYKLAIISGSIDIVLEKFLPNYQKIFDYVFINKFIFNKKGQLTRGIGTPFDMEHKAKGLKLICQKENILLEQTIFIGDNTNDVQIAKLAGKTIAFNCKSRKLAKIADVVVKKKDLREILKHI